MASSVVGPVVGFVKGHGMKFVMDPVVRLLVSPVGFLVEEALFQTMDERHVECWPEMMY